MRATGWAYASALSVVEEPGAHANPLVLHGPTGVGKTHLLEGIYVGLKKGWPEAKLCYITAEDFTNRFVQAMRFGKLAGFRKQFREVEALLIDDLNFLASKKATQEEFLHTFDALVSDGKQVVMTADCHPRLCEELLPELVDRLLGGAVWGLAPPDGQTRLDLLKAKSAGTTPRDQRGRAATARRPAARQRPANSKGRSTACGTTPASRASRPTRTWRARRLVNYCGTRCGWSRFRTSTRPCARP